MRCVDGTITFREVILRMTSVSYFFVIAIRSNTDNNNHTTTTTSEANTTTMKRPLENH